jgi:uncharacterized protein YyaL (SSP411 family)
MAGSFVSSGVSFRRALFIILAVTAPVWVLDLPSRAANAPAEGIPWQPWNAAAFAEAKREHKFVLLDLHAVWCHWCHVMDETTYHDPRVIALIRSHYIAVGVDQDAQPDLATRYQDYGWPATIVFNAEGGEIVKRQGYLPPEQMVSILQAIVDDPSPGPSVTNEKGIDPSKTGVAANDALRRQLDGGYDSVLGGWGRGQKFLNWDNVEYCLVRAQAGDQQAEKMAKQTLAAQRQLLDPVWGGVDQYSAGGDWKHPHFEKLMQFQAENMRIYSEAYAQWKDPLDLQAAQGIYKYVREFLTSPDGVVYTSQDADLVPGEYAAAYFSLDDAHRRALGLPKVDRHIYARENGWFIEALTVLFQASGDIRCRDEAIRAANWVIKNRAIDGGGFRHGQEAKGPRTLGDNLAMARAFLGLYTITADRVWLEKAEQTTAFIADHFSYKIQGNSVGFATSEGDFSPALSAPKPDFDENVSLARMANLLFHYTGNSRDREMAEAALRFASEQEVAQQQISSVGGLLLAKMELATDPLHVAVVGGKGDPLARHLFEIAVAFPVIYKEVEWIDSSSTTPSSPSISYPPQPRAAAYLCANQTCSAPVFDVKKLSELLLASQKKLSD